VGWCRISHRPKRSLSAWRRDYVAWEAYLVSAEGGLVNVRVGLVGGAAPPRFENTTLRFGTAPPRFGATTPRVAGCGKAGGECVRARCADSRCLRRPAMKPSEAARSVAAPGLCKPAYRTGCCTICKQHAAMFETAGGCGEKLDRRAGGW
jgi:hypothetical protein